MGRFTTSSTKSEGFTIIETLTVIVLISILGSLFGGMLISAAKVYSDQSQRKTRHVDSRRAMEMISHDVREWNSWQSTPSVNTIDFEQSELIEGPGGNNYYGFLRTAYNFTSNRLTYQRNEAGTWANQYYVLDGDVVMGTSQFSETIAGTTSRIRVTLELTIEGRPMRFRTTIFPRSQGG